MTIHAAFRKTPAQVADLPRLVSRAVSRRGVLQLLAALGLETLKSLPSRSRSMYVVGERGMMRALLHESPVALRRGDVRSMMIQARATESIRPLLLVIAGPGYDTLTFATATADGDVLHMTLAPAAPLQSELDVLRRMVAEPDESGISLSLRYIAALDTRALGARFFAEVRAHRELLTDAWYGLPVNAIAEREQLSLLLLCRLMFLYFLQRQGRLAGDSAYLMSHVRRWRRDGSGSLFDSFLKPLFFGALNTRPERRDPAALALGDLPYLNGGLFERHGIERRYPDLGIDDGPVLALFYDLLERYRFTADDSGAGQHGGGLAIDPEMLGRVFEGLMSADRRGDTGTFYTPPTVVDRLATAALATLLSRRLSLPVSAARKLLSGDVTEIPGSARGALLDALQRLRVLDPACGSGAFLLGALARLTSARVALGESSAEARRSTVATALHGVDLLDDAALLCSLRLWLALADTSTDPPLPLPNLDRRIRQGDALIDPLDALISRTGADVDARAVRDPAVRSALARLQPLAAVYVHAEPDERIALRANIVAAERELAQSWMDAMGSRLQAELADAEARACDRDLFDQRTTSANVAEREAYGVRKRISQTDHLAQQLRDAAALPFFSFRVHFAETPRFDVALSNPPWVRAHRWPAAMAGAVRERYRVCTDAGWPAASMYGGARASGQVDLSLLFLERTVTLLEDDGVFAALLPAKMLRSLYAGGGRALLQQKCVVTEIDDFSLDQRSVFKADAFTCAVVMRRTGDGETQMLPEEQRAEDQRTEDQRVRVHMTRRGVPPLDFDMPREDLPLIAGDDHAPWLIAPRDVTSAFRLMQCNGRALATMKGLKLGRGVVTGANDVFIAREFAHKLGGLSHIRTEGYFRARKLSHSTADARRFVAYVETDSLRPLLRGADVRAWRAKPSSRVIYVPANERAGAAAPPRTAAFLKRHDATLRARTGVARAAAPGRLMRLSAATSGHKVVWQDISDTLCAAAVPARAIGDGGAPVPVLPLNSVYFVGVDDEDTALLLAAYLNALPLRLFARATAERAKDARFRFFAWTVGVLPLPHGWMVENRAEILAISRAAHDSAGICAAAQARLDALVASAYRLRDEDMVAMLAFDRWLSGVS